MDKKFGADLMVENGRVGGLIHVSETTFLWKPVRFLFFGRNIPDIEAPISQLEGYTKSDVYISIGLKGYDTLYTFYTWKGASIIAAIEAINPDFHMYSSDEVRY